MSIIPPPSLPLTERRIAVVLGGGGLKGFAHIGVLRALEERGVRASLLAGTSIGALIAAARATGMSVAELQSRAMNLHRRDLFRINHVGMLLERMRAPSIYLEAPLRALCESVLPRKRLSELDMPLLINTVDIERGTQVVWGLAGLRDVSLREAVYASCALPGFFPPGRVGTRTCVDGGTIDNLPVAIASLGADAVIAVDVGNTDVPSGGDAVREGFASIFMRSATIMMHALQVAPLSQWTGGPMILIRPKVSHINWFDFTRTAELIEAGYRGALEALEWLDDCLSSPGGVFPRQPVHVRVDRDRCTGCGLCVSLAPTVMWMDPEGKAYAHQRTLVWSPADGDFVKQCPTDAITVQEVEGY